MAMELRGALNFSKYYKPGSNQPKFYGKALIEGVEYTVKGWEKVRQDTGEIWISLLFEDPAQEAERHTSEFAPAPKKQPKYTPNYKDLDDDIPF